MSALEDTLAQHLDYADIPYQREVRFAAHLRNPATGRPYMYRADFWIDCGDDPPLVVEIEGGIYRGGGHSSVTGLKRDIAKANLMTELGIRLIRVHGDMVRSGEALAIIERIVRKEQVA